MRTMIVVPVLLSMMFVPGCMRAHAGPSVHVSVGASFGSGCYDCDDMDYDDLMYISDTEVAVWVMLPSGRWVLRCRSMWYDAACDEWRFGPWWYNYYVSYSGCCHGCYRRYCPFHHVRFSVFMERHYPRYYHRHFHNHRWIRPVPRIYGSERHGHLDGDRRHVEPAVSRSAPASSGQLHKVEGGTHTTVIRKESTAPVKTNGGVRVQRDIFQNHGREIEVTRSRSVTRGRETVTRTSTTRVDRTRDLRRR